MNYIHFNIIKLLPLKLSTSGTIVFLKNDHSVTWLLRDNQHVSLYICKRKIDMYVLITKAYMSNFLL